MNKKMITLAVMATGALVYSCSEDSSKGELEDATGEETPITEDYVVGANNEDCTTAPAYWFPHSQTPQPAEGADSPFGNPDSTTNCDFHMWSWQKFLYLTRTDANGKANFEKLIHVDNHLTPLMDNVDGTNLILNDTTQAGFTAGTLYDKNNNPIYYSIYVDSTLYDFSMEYLPKFDSVGYDGLAAAGYDTLTFPIGALEVKASWILASNLTAAERENYYITSAHMGSSTGDTVSVALLGMHVVGVVDNHPEFIWATFEHSDLAPDYDWTSTDSLNQVLSNDNSLFYDAGQTAAECPMNYSTAKLTEFKSIYKVYALGMAQSYDTLPSAADISNNEHIEALNASVHAALSTPEEVAYGPWDNYFYAGSIWIDPTVATITPNNKQMGQLSNANLKGSRANANITMETYEQPDVSTSKISGVQNCFTCHTTHDDDAPGNYGYNMAFSHLFTNALAKMKDNTKSFDNN